MNRVLTITIAALMWLGVAAWVVLSVRYAAERRATIAVRQVRIDISGGPRGDQTGGHRGGLDNHAPTPIMAAEEVRGWLDEDGFSPLGRPIDEVDTREIGHNVAARTKVAAVSVRTDLGGNLTLRIVPRELSVRVFSPRDSSTFWVTRDGRVLPHEAGFAAPSPLVVSTFSFPFSPKTSAEYAALKRDNYDHYVEQFTAIHAEGRSLTAQRSSTRAALLRAQNSGPKRFWGHRRKEQFEADRAARITALTREAKNIDAALKDLAEEKKILTEKEKISYTRYGFLPKLANFVEFVARSEYWGEGGGRIERIHVGDAGELWLIPPGGAQSVEFGELDGSELEKLEKLKAFYMSGEAGKFARIDVKYSDQIVCTTN